jgi:small subunit ribosomal protein S16
MATVIRLRRIGKNPKKKPHFRVTVFSGTKGRDSRFIEEIGYYNPITGAAKIDVERFEHWVSKGAQPSLTVKNLVKKSKKA